MVFCQKHNILMYPKAVMALLPTDENLSSEDSDSSASSDQSEDELKDIDES